MPKAMELRQRKASKELDQLISEQNETGVWDSDDESG